MKRTALVTALVLATGAATIAVAQSGGPPEDPGGIAEQASAFGECVATASEEGVENPTELCVELRPGPPTDNGDSNGGPADGTPADECAGESKEDGSFGECVAEHASAFGQCVHANAEAGVVNPAEACAELAPGGGPPEGVSTGPPEGVRTGPPEGTPNGPPEGVSTGPPEGTPSGPPEGVSTGPPEGTPSGPPGGTPTGPPEGTPTGPPEGVPTGPPFG